MASERSRSRTIIGLYVSSLLLPMSGAYLFPVLPSVTTGLGAPEYLVSALVGVYTMPALFFGIPLGILADRYGRGALYRVGLLLLGVPGLLMAAAPSFYWAMALRFLQGVGFAIANPLSIGLISDLEAGATETRAQGFRIAVLDVADFALPTLAGALVTVDWRVPFLLFGLATPISLYATRVIPVQTVSPESGQASVREHLRGLGSLYRVPGMAAAIGAGFFGFFLKFAVLTYLPLLASARMGASPAQVGLAVGLLGLTGGIAALMTGSVASRWGRASVVLAAVGLASAVCFGLGLTRSMAVAFGLMLAYGIADGLLRSCLNSLVSREVPETVRAASLAVSGLFRNLGKTVGPLLLGVFAARGQLQLGYLLLGVLGLVSLQPLRALPRLEGQRGPLVEQTRPVT